jgi:hypothetical protein
MGYDSVNVSWEPRLGADAEFFSANVNCSGDEGYLDECEYSGVAKYCSIHQNVHLQCGN